MSLCHSHYVVDTKLILIHEIKISVIFKVTPFFTYYRREIKDGDH